MPLLLLALALSPPADWREFRGPDGVGIYSGPALPTEWGPDTNVTWVTPVPGKGWSSPILVGGKLILTTAVPLSESQDADQSLRALAFDFATGKPLWDVELLRAPAELVSQKHKKNGDASPTPASDGQTVVCHFGHLGTAAVDMAGKVLWATRELAYQPMHGNGASPILADDLVFIPCDGRDVTFVAALDLATGKVRWKTDRKTIPKMSFSFATPQIVTAPDGKKVLVSPASDYCLGYDPHTGAELWRCKYPQPGWSLICRPVFAHGLVYISTGYVSPHILAIDPFRTGDVAPAFDWKVKMYAPNTPTPLVLGDELYLIADMGYLSCVDARTGKTHYTERLAGKSYSASPIAADGKLWLTSEEGVGQVVAAGKEFREISRSSMGEKTFASFVPAAGSLVVRTESQLYRFAAKRRIGPLDATPSAGHHTDTCRYSPPMLVALLLSFAPAPDQPDGAAIYKNQCARCHGPAGQGAKKYPKPLAGDLAVPQLAEYVARTMPEDDPESLSSAEAKAVAEYMIAGFYGKPARDRRTAVRADLSRLTVRQYDNAVADLLGSFRPAPAYTFKPEGVRAEPVKYNRKDFVGSLYAPLTGDYEFVFRLPEDVRGRVWLNDFTGPLIDAWVRSGPEGEFRGRARLVGGRAYRLKVEAVTIDKFRNKKKDFVGPPPPMKEPDAVLSWVPPGGRPRETVPDRFLAESKVPEVYVNPVAFPPDDRSMGWERGNFVSKAWDQAATEAAVAVADHIAARLDELAGTKPDAKDRADKLKAFVATFAERAFRRPLDEKQKGLYVEGPFKREADPALAVRRAVLLALKSPRFLYREVGEPAPQHDTAARLAFALWDGLPDKELRQAAEKGQLATPEQVRKQAERMRSDPRFGVKLTGYLRHWLQVEQMRDLVKDPKKYPGFDPAAVADLRASLDRTLADAVADGDFRNLFVGDGVYLTGRLAKLYGADLPADAPLTKVPLDPARRAGVLTHPFLLASFSYAGASSPIHRGVFLARGVMGRVLMPPQEAISPLAEDLHPDLSTRERVTLQTKGATCQGCHTLVNPLGFTLEGFDGIGKWRELDRGKPVDTTGSYTDRAGKAWAFAGPNELAKYVADSPEVHAAVAEGVFHHLIGQPVRAFGADAAEKLREAFAAGGYDLRKLAVEAAVLGALPRPPAVAIR